MRSPPNLFFLFQVHACAGKPEGEPTESYIRSAADILLSCLEKYRAAGNELRGRNITMDRGYTSYDLFTRIGQEFNMTCLGTVQGSRKGIPKELIRTDNRPAGDYQVEIF